MINQKKDIMYVGNGKKWNEKKTTRYVEKFVEMLWNKANMKKKCIMVIKELEQTTDEMYANTPTTNRVWMRPKEISKSSGLLNNSVLCVCVMHWSFHNYSSHWEWERALSICFWFSTAFEYHTRNGICRKTLAYKKKQRKSKKNTQINV